MKRQLMPADVPLGEPKHAFEDTLSAFTVIKERFFPHLLDEKEKAQIGPARTAATLSTQIPLAENEPRTMAAKEFKPAELRDMAENASPLHKSALRFVAELFEMADDKRYSNEMIGIRVRNQLNHL